MCLGRVANKLFGSGNKSKPQPETPDPVGQESPTKTEETKSDKSEDKVKTPTGRTGDSSQDATQGGSSLSDDGITY